MNSFAKEELNLVVQGIAGLILALITIILLNQVVPNFNTIAIASLAFGFIMLYGMLSKNHKFLATVLAICGMGIAFSFIF